MVFQVIIVGSGAVQIDVPFFRQQQFLGAIFINHISAVVSCGSDCTHLMYCAELPSVRSIQVSDGVAITERNYLWQI